MYGRFIPSAMALGITILASGPFTRRQRVGRQRRPQLARCSRQTTHAHRILDSLSCLRASSRCNRLQVWLYQIAIGLADGASSRLAESGETVQQELNVLLERQARSRPRIWSDELTQHRNALDKVFVSLF